MEVFVILAVALVVGLVVLAQRQGKFDRIAEDDAPGDGVAEHMDGLADQDRLVQQRVRNPMTGGGSVRGSGTPFGGGGSGSGGGAGGGGGGDF